MFFCYPFPDAYENVMAQRIKNISTDHSSKLITPPTQDRVQLKDNPTRVLLSWFWQNVFNYFFQTFNTVFAWFNQEFWQVIILIIFITSKIKAKKIKPFLNWKNFCLLFMQFQPTFTQKQIYCWKNFFFQKLFWSWCNKDIISLSNYKYF